MKHKRYTIRAVFPQALAKAAIQSTTVEASSLPLATSRGLKDILRRPGIKGTHIGFLKLAVSITSVTTEDSEEEEPPIH